MLTFIQALWLKLVGAGKPATNPPAGIVVVKPVVAPQVTGTVLPNITPIPVP